MGVALGRVSPVGEKRVRKYQRIISDKPEMMCKPRTVFRNVLVDDSRWWRL